MEATESGWSVSASGPISATVRGSRRSTVCRLQPGADRDLVQLASGRAASRLCDSLYDPLTDEALTFSGQGVTLTPGPVGRFRVTCEGSLVITRTPGFMRKVRGLPFYRPLRRNPFKRAPAGWCSWYYYYQEITEAEVRLNLAWLAENLAPFGCEWLLVDDGWQGQGSGWGTNRDWFAVCERDFPNGMRALADAIREQGMRPGIWCIPFTQSDPRLSAREPGLFLRRADGSSPGELPELQGDETWPSEERSVEWAGRYFVDPTSAAAPEYLRRLIGLLCDEWGYDYLKLDAMGMMARFYEACGGLLSDQSLIPAEAFRLGLRALADAAGPWRFLLCCAQAYDSVGFCQGIRTGSDIEPDWQGYQIGIDATLRYLFLNTIAFYTDPDVVCVREPLPLEQARLWATFVALTGQVTMASDRMYSLPEERVALLRRIFPVADIHPMELYPLSTQARPHVFDLKVAPARAEPWDVVALFNWNDREWLDITLSPGRLGLPPGRVVWTDGWYGELLHAGDGEWCVRVPPAESRLICCWPDLRRPRFAGSDRHVTNGAVDLISTRWDARRVVLTGRSAVVGGHPTEVRIYVPPGYRPLAECGAEGGIARLRIGSHDSGPVNWQLRFTRE